MTINDSRRLNDGRRPNDYRMTQEPQKYEMV